MVNLLIKSCQNNPKTAPEKVENTQMEMESDKQPAEEVTTKTNKILIFLRKALKIALVILVLYMTVWDVVLVAKCLLRPETNIKESLQNVSKQIKNHSLEKDFVSYVVSSIPWTTDYIVAAEIVFLLYIWAISFMKPKPSFEIVNIFVGNLLDKLALCCVVLHLLALIRLAYLHFMPDFTIPSYIFAITTFFCVGTSLVKIVVFDLKKAQLGIHDPRSFLKKVSDYWRFKKSDADHQLQKADTDDDDDIEEETRLHEFFFCVLLLSGIHVFVQQELHIWEINDEIGKYVGDLVKMDVESHVRIFLGFCDYLVIADLVFLGYLCIIKSVLTESKPFVTRVHIVSGTWIYWTTLCCMFLEYILLSTMVITNFALLDANFTDPIYLIFVELCLVFCYNYISDFVLKLANVSRKQFELSECA